MKKFSQALFAGIFLSLLAAPGRADGPGTLKLDEESFEIREDSGFAILTVERSQGEDGAVSVRFSTRNGSAVAGQDYPPVSGTLTWGPGDGSDKTFTVPILDDSQAEGTETIQLVLSDPTGGASIDADRGTVTLVEVTDTVTGVTKEYKNPAGQAADPVQDTVTFETCSAR